MERSVLRNGAAIKTALVLVFLILSSAVRADTYAIWWSPELASQSVEALEAARDGAIAPLVLSNGKRTETATDCAAAADAFSRGFRELSKGDHNQFLECRALALIARAGEAAISSYRDAPVPDYALEPDDVFALPALAGPVKGCAETLIALRSDQGWWSLARHVHVYFGPDKDGPADDGREAQSIALDPDTAPASAVMTVRRFGDGGLALALDGRRATLIPLGLGDFNGDGLEDLLLRTETEGEPARLIEMTQLKSGTVMTVLEPLDHFRPVLRQCPELALRFAVAECAP